MATADDAAPRITHGVAVGMVTAGAAVAGAVLGVLWARLAPPAHAVVALTHQGDRVQAYLGDEGDHFFTAPFLALGLLAVLAVVTAALAWQWRPHRGPAMAAGLVAGLVAAAALAVLVGVALVHHRYGAVDIDTAPVTPEHRLYYYAEAPPVFFGHLPLQVAATLLAPAAVAGFAYALCTAFTARDDLGGYPPIEPLAVEPAAAPPGATAEVTTGGGVPPHR
ncbi:MAG TPA: DUF2567 domain-containing protein [Mycobacterium sp.]|nr:DUF2567 domain-containing protein [Mycobacterium sp.]